MNRIHIHISVDDLEKNRQFYNGFLGVEPRVVKHDYMKWQLDDPALNFSISNRASKSGIDHLGIQFSEPAGLHGIKSRLIDADIDFDCQEDATCCYANSDKTWLKDPQGISWENFFTHGSVADFGAEDSDHYGDTIDANQSCCIPEPGQQSCCSG